MPVTRFIKISVLALLMLAIPTASFAGISITVAPPPLPVYVQPPCVQAGYMWTPGYWAWGDDGYFWVPGTWVPAPSAGLLWTPGYWGWNNGFFAWNAGYWGPQVGFYGGVNYGFGYGGMGFGGGEWRGGNFFYNTAVVNVGGGAHITNVYVNKTVIVNNTTNVSYNGGTGGISRTPTAAEQAAARAPHTQPTAAQVQHETAASHNTQLLAKNNGGKPAIAATAKSGDFSTGAVPAKAAGGKMEPTTLNASAKSMPPAAKTAAAPAHAPSKGVNPDTPFATKTASPAVSHPPANAASRPNPAVSTPKSQPPKQPAAPVVETRKQPAPAVTTPKPVTVSRPVAAAKPAIAPKLAAKPASAPAHAATPKPPEKKDKE